jgi:hypothetical protein
MPTLSLRNRAEAAVNTKVELKKTTVVSASGRNLSAIKNVKGAKKPIHPRKACCRGFLVASSASSPLIPKIARIMSDIIQLRIAITWIADISALTSYLATASMTTNSNIASIIRPMPSRLLV